MTLRRLLIANRGEIARRVIRTAHRLGLETVAVHSDADADALHVREATLAHALGGDASADSYLRIDKLIAAAQATGADAVHPGYGFLSENADFAQAVLDAGLVWVGPPPAAIRALGSKSACKQLAQARGVPCLPGYHGPAQSDAELSAEAARIGVPLMVKAAAGGGGRGMRLVTDMDKLEAALQGARSEAIAAFGSGELLLERALLNPRHVEVQVFADAHGRCIHIGERDCSVQRRHQKLIEETPSPAVDDTLRAAMGQCAVELALAAGYVGAGTVEFLLEEEEEGSLSAAGPPLGAKAPSGGSAAHAVASVGPQFFLMEMNTRLQVEHPVTEAVTGLDLVEWQLRIADGEPLPLAQEELRFDGHAIEVRLCAEDETFTPHAGTVLHFREPGTVRFDHALFEGQQVPPFYDSMLGKLVAHAPTRAQAIAQLAGALGRLELLGLPTNRQFLAACLRHPQFLAGGARIPFLAEQGDAVRDLLSKKEQEKTAAGGVLALFPSKTGHILPQPFERVLRLRHRGQMQELRVQEAALAVPQGRAVQLADGRWHVLVAGVDLFLEDASFEPPGGAAGGAGAGELRAPFNGKVIAVLVAAGATVLKGDTLLVVESMKLEHALAAPRNGMVRAVQVEVGQQLSTSQVLVSFEPAP